MRHAGSWVHETARVSDGTELGAHARVGAGSRIERAIIEGTVGGNCKVWRFAHVMTGAVVGNDCMIAANVLIADGSTLGNNCRVQNNTCISRRVTIGNDVFIGSGVAFCNGTHPTVTSSFDAVPITVKDGASIGSNVCLIGEITIGEGAVVGAGSVVTKDVPDGVTVVGSPARPVEKRAEEFQNIKWPRVSGD